MAALEAIARMTFEGRTDGLDKAATELNAASSAQEKVAETAAASGRASETSARGQLSLSTAYERLLRQIDPTFRAQQKLAKGQAILDRSFAQGHGVESYARNLDLLKSKYSSVAAANTNFAKAAETSSFQVSNLAAQFQDIAVQLQAGTSPMTVALQQGTQISAVLGPMGAGGAVKSLAAAFLSVVSPISLVTVGVITLGGMAAQYIAGMGKGVEDLDAKLKRHSDIIKDIKASYGDALKGVEEYASASKTVLEAQLRASMVSLRDEIKKTTTEFLSSVGQTQRIRFVGVVNTVNPDYKPFQDAIAKFREQAAKGEPDIRALRDSIAATMNEFRDNAKLQEFGGKILDASKNAAQLDAALRTANGTILATGAAAAESAGRVKLLDQALASLQGLALPDLTDMEKAVDAYRKGIDNAASVNDRRRVDSEFLGAQSRINIRDTKKALEELTQAEQNAALQGMKPLERATEEANIKFRDRIKEIERLKKNGADSAAVAKLEAGAQKVLAQELRNAAEAESERGAKSRDAWADALTTARARTQQIEEETRLIGQNGAELEANKLRIELEAAAKKKSIAITDEVRASIEGEVEARRKAAQELNATRLMSDLGFERDQMFRDPVEQQVYSRLRSAGIEYNSVQGEMIAGQIRFNEALKETQAAGSEALKGFLDDMKRGLSFSKSLDNALARVGDRLGQNALDKVTGGLFGGTGGSPFAANDNRPGGMTNQDFFSGMGEAVKKGFSSLFGGSSITEKAPLEGSFQRAAVASGQPGGTLGFGNMGGLAGGALAVAGAYGSGKSSGSPLMGGLTGALSGAMAGSAFGPIGTVVGAIAGGASGIFGGLMGQKDAKKERRRQMAEAQQQAVDNWNSIQPQAAQFRSEMRGEPVGGLRTSWNDATQKTQQLADAASKAGDTTAAMAIWDDLNAYARRTTDAFKTSFGGVVDALRDGVAPGGPFQAAHDSIQQLGTGLKGFIADAATVYGSGSAEVKKAQDAARAFALSSLGGQTELSKVQTEMQRIQGTAAGLGQVLQDLGMSSSEAARAIKDGVSKALNALRSEFTNDLTRRINDATGKGYFNETADLIKERNQMLADAKRLHLDPSMVDRYFAAAAQKIVNSSELTGGAFDELIKAFPALNGVVTQFAGALEEAASRTASAINSIQKYLDDLRGGQNSTLSPTDRLNEAQSAYQRELLKAQGGNLDSLSGITGYAQNLLDASRDYYGSGAGYQDFFAQVTSQLESLQRQFGGVSAVPSAVAVSTAATTPVSAVTVPTASVPAVANDNGLIAELRALRQQAEGQRQEIAALRSEIAAGLGEVVAAENASGDKVSDTVSLEIERLRADTRTAASRPAVAGSRR